MKVRIPATRWLFGVRGWLAIGILALLSSCNVCYNPPPVTTPDASTWKTAEALGPGTPTCETRVYEDTPQACWWTIFEDPLLNSLMEQAIPQSPSIQYAVAKLKEVSALYGTSCSYLYPQIDLQGFAHRQRVSSTLNSFTVDSSAGVPAPTAPTTPQPTAGLPTLPPVPAAAPAVAPQPTQPIPAAITVPSHLTQLAVFPEISYEIDFWSKYWQASEAALQDVIASKEDLATAMQLLSEEVALAYFDLCASDELIVVFEDTIAVQQKFYNYYRVRYDKGLNDALDYKRAEVELTSVKAQLEDAKRTRALAEDALAVFVGVPASSFELPRTKLPTVFPRVPAGVPSEMLRNRPDILSKEANLEAARLRVGVAETAYFPSVVLSADWGFASSTASHLFKWKSRIWDLTASVLTPIFTAGRISSDILAAKAVYEETLAQYMQQVLIAFQEVEDALAIIEYREQQRYWFEEERKAAQAVLDMSNDRYTLGLTDIFDVVNAEQTLLNAQEGEIQVTSDRLGGIVRLIKSIGGAWDGVIPLPDTRAVLLAQPIQ